MKNKPNGPKCDSCFVINNYLRCCICKYRTEEWMKKNMAEIKPVMDSDFDMYHSKKISESMNRFLIRSGKR